MFTFAIRSRFSPPEFPNVWSAVSFCSHHASVLHGFSFLCLQCGNCRAGLAGTIQEQIVDEEWRQPQQIEESYCFPAAIARRQHEWSRQFPPTEKAGGGGSTPSVATIVLNNLAESRLALPVRSQSAIFRRDPVRFLATMMVKNLKIELPLAQSAFSPLLSAAWLKIAVSIAPAAAMQSSLTRRDMEAPFRTGCVPFRASRR
jgi:hypothetical protein